jgi:hypothetical protein
MSKSEKSTLSPGDEGEPDLRAKRPYQEQRLHYGQRTPHKPRSRRLDVRTGREACKVAAFRFQI